MFRKVEIDEEERSDNDQCAEGTDDDDDYDDNYDYDDDKEERIDKACSEKLK